MKKILTFWNLIKTFQLKKAIFLLGEYIPRLMILSSRSHRSINNILNGYSHSSSFSFKIPLEPVPWMTYPFVDFMKNLNLSQKNIFEYGSGYSTVFWAKCSSKVVSVENDKFWFKELTNSISSNVNLLLRDNKESFINAINETNDMWDIIILDGYGFRYECALESVSKLKPGGMIILDDSDNIQYKRICDFLKNNDLIQIDFIGLKPGSDNIVATSAFLKRDYNFGSRFDHVQPKIFIGEQRDYKA
jgi:hypothetical protein